MGRWWQGTGQRYLHKYKLKRKNIHEMYQELWYNTEVFFRKK